MIIKMAIEEVRAVVSAIKDLHQFGRNIRKARAEKFSGNWTNEGSIGGELPTHYVDLELIVEGVEVTGVISSRKLDDETYMNNQSFNGRRSGYHINGQVIAVSQGNVECYGEVRLHLRNGVLNFKGTKLIADFLPTETTLWRHELASFFLLRSQKKETKEKATLLPLISFGLSAASGRLWNSGYALRQSSPLFHLPLKPKARQGG